MFAVVQNGNIVQLIQPDVAFVIGEKQYSARFIRNATEAERKSVGVYEVIYGEQQDQRFYWVTGPSYRVNETNQTVVQGFVLRPAPSTCAYRRKSATPYSVYESCLSA